MAFIEPMHRNKPNITYLLTTVLSLTWESPYLGKTVFVLKRGPAIPADYILELVVIIQFPFTSYIIYFEYTFMAVDGLVTWLDAMASELSSNDS